MRTPGTRTRPPQPQPQPQSQPHSPAGGAGGPFAPRGCDEMLPSPFTTVPRYLIATAAAMMSSPSDVPSTPADTPRSVSPRAGSRDAAPPPPLLAVASTPPERPRSGAGARSTAGAGASPGRASAAAAPSPPSPPRLMQVCSEPPDRPRAACTPLAGECADGAPVSSGPPTNYRRGRFSVTVQQGETPRQAAAQLPANQSLPNLQAAAPEGAAAAGAMRHSGSAAALGAAPGAPAPQQPQQQQQQQQQQAAPTRAPSGQAPGSRLRRQAGPEEPHLSGEQAQWAAAQQRQQAQARQKSPRGAAGASDAAAGA
ncbi:hypothetical protein MNEG_4207, partial [Monoraphidium neglectum]